MDDLEDYNDEDTSSDEGLADHTFQLPNNDITLDNRNSTLGGRGTSQDVLQSRQRVDETEGSDFFMQ